MDGFWRSQPVETPAIRDQGIFLQDGDAIPIHGPMYPGRMDHPSREPMRLFRGSKSDFRSRSGPFFPEALTNNFQSLRLSTSVAAQVSNRGRWDMRPFFKVQKLNVSDLDMSHGSTQISSSSDVGVVNPCISGVSYLPMSFEDKKPFLRETRLTDKASAARTTPVATHPRSGQVDRGVWVLLLGATEIRRASPSVTACRGPLDVAAPRPDPSR